MNKHYVYMYADPTKGLPFYIGVGCGQRWRSHLREASKPHIKGNNHKLNTIRALKAKGLEPIVIKLVEGISREQAIELEIQLISILGRRDLETGCLTNLTNGGDGVTTMSDANRVAMSQRQTGTICVRDEAGELFRVSGDDPRWLSGELVGHNKGISCSNKDGKLDDYIQAKNPETGECFRVKPDDLRWVSGELVGVNKGKAAHPNTVAAAKKRRGIQKPETHGKAVSKALKGISWYHNFDTGHSVRLTAGKPVPAGYVKVSSPGKLTVITEGEMENA